MLLVVDNLQIMLPLMVTSWKLVIFRWKRTVLLSIVKMMTEDWMTPKIKTERDVMVKRAQTARIIVIIGYILMIFMFILIIVLPCFGLSYRHLTNLTDRDRPLPLSTYYFYDTDKSPQFELTFFVQATTIFLAVIPYTSVDAFLGIVVFHICGQLENFERRLVSLTSCKDFDSALRDNMRAHIRLIRFAAYIEDMFALLMLGLVFYFGIIFCVYGFLFVIMLTGEMSDISLQRVFFLITGIFTLLAHTFLYCGAGEMVMEQCKAVHRAACDLEWYRLKPKEGRTLILLILRANEPFYITAGKIFPLTMTTFCSLLKTSIGYISFLLANREA
ncbi:odorant receptor 10-like [Anoplolepis gracilipes]|uniref:odorant receptor 10-like n=1 Tax=Anoplolepis gracilipes TaxID=354296 RepID=UPI003B9E1570